MEVYMDYPAVFEPFGDRPGYTVTVPDLPGCVTEGDSLAEAILMAQDAASGWIQDELEDGKNAPSASDPSEVYIEGEQFVKLLTLHLRLSL